MQFSSSASPRILSLATLVDRLAECHPRLVGDERVEVESTTEDSRRVSKGALFVARAGEKVDGRAFIQAALQSGATAILCEAGAGVTAEPRIEVVDIRKAWGIAAQELAGRPFHELPTVGITGTNGKTTVACLVEQGLRTAGFCVGRLGTLGFFVDDQRLADSLTTPQPDQLANCFLLARGRGADSMVLEVSSHALDQQRVAGLKFEVAAFTNLSQDHLDYHADMTAYGNAKARLFREHGPRYRVLNVDDAWGERLAAEFPESLTVSASGNAARLVARRAEFTRTGLRAEVEHEGKMVTLESSLLGQHNLENLLVAWGILFCLGLSSEQAARGLCLARGVPGRLERCDEPGDDIVVVVDYAHTPDALRRALTCLVGLDFGSVSCVFGCGGDRDRTKRAPMGAVAGEFADHIYLTSDNPRSEVPEQILADVLVGLSGARGRLVTEVDRRRAISRAVLEAPAGSVVLVAGKGHEDYQLIFDQVLHFDDREEARAALALRRGTT